MSKQPTDDTLSVATTLTPTPEVRTTLTGRPITYSHDNYTNMLTGGTLGGGDARMGANLLPPGYTDNSLVHIPIRVSEYMPPSSPTSSAPYDLGNDVNWEPARKGSVWSRISKRMSGRCKKSGGKDDGLRVVEMSRGDYLKYWAKGEDGQFREDVVEPPGGRAEWLADRLEKQDGPEGEGKSDMGRKKSRGTEGKASAVSAIGGAIGSVS
ncbi:hypothetical protein Q7P37_006976 [Cladosporium fusiforme]